MKYMGSKRAMLQNGLGEFLDREIGKSKRFVDLFTGSGAVAVHVAQRYSIPVFAFDLQQYSAVLAGAVVSRESNLPWENTWKEWKSKAESRAFQGRIPDLERLTQRSVAEARKWCEGQSDLPITKAYGAHYFSPQQAIQIDLLRQTLPNSEPMRTVSLAALIQAASQCAAAPGHTAQPFQPTRTAKEFLADAWERNLSERTASALKILCGQHARAKGCARVEDANYAAEHLQAGDLTFIDPPYSGVHYSRFYHVLETIAAGKCGEVSGTGRYPDRTLRPRSKYSVTSEAEDALEELLETISEKGARGIVTFPDHECSNGLSGDSVREIAASHFRVTEKHVESKFSTLGGVPKREQISRGRLARLHAKELILLLDPK